MRSVLPIQLANLDTRYLVLIPSLNVVLSLYICQSLFIGKSRYRLSWVFVSRVFMLFYFR
jgi:hypothetical protein